MKTFYVGKGKITCPEVGAQWGKATGDDEWQFSDGPVGKRSFSYDYPSLEAGMKALSPATFIMEEF